MVTFGEDGAGNWRLWNLKSPRLLGYSTVSSFRINEALPLSGVVDFYHDAGIVKVQYTVVVKK